MVEEDGSTTKAASTAPAESGPRRLLLAVPRSSCRPTQTGCQRVTRQGKGGAHLLVWGDPSGRRGARSGGDVPIAQRITGDGMTLLLFLSF
jgi:hypothetical protein